MAINWTDDQLKIIKERNKDILVSAAAGSGKTAVLVERIIRRITEDKIDIDRMLIVTFTRAAAAQMKEKIYSALFKLSRESEDRHVLKQLSLIHNAPISTIDSFCASIVREHFHEIGIDPDFRMCDEEEKQILMEEALEEILEEAYRENREEFKTLVLSYTKRDKDDALKDMIKSVYEEAMANPWPIESIRGMLSSYEAIGDGHVFDSEWGKSLTKHLRECLKGIKESLWFLRNKGSEMSMDGDPHPYLDTLDKDLDEVGFLVDIKEDSKFHLALSTFKFGTLSRKKCTYEDEEIKEYIKARREIIKKNLEDIKELCIGDEEFFRNSLEASYSMAKELINLVIKYIDRYDEKKRQMSLMDFSDIEHFALKILVDEKTKECTETALSLREHFTDVMVDEYQDSNYLQESILTAVAKDEPGFHNYFMVGDVKQSIYAFRKAKPSIFIDKFNRFDSEDTDNIRIDLGSNFRSRKEVVDTVNDIFFEIMKKDIGGVEYDERARLNCGAIGFAEGGSFNTRLSYVNSEDEAFKEEKLGSVALDAHLCAYEIKRIIKDAKVTDEETGMLRHARYSDIVILHRNAGKVASTYLDVLRANTIPAQIISSEGYFESREIETAISMLYVLNNPLYDIPLVATLKNVFGITEECLCKIKGASREGAFFERLKAYKDLNIDDKNINDFFEFFYKVRALVGEESLYEILCHCLYDTGYYDRVLSMPSGDSRSANLDKLLSLAISFEVTGFRGVFSFIEYVEKMKEYKRDFGTADIADGDSVRIMTFHKSKGLEYPIVIVAGLGRALLKSNTSQVLLHSKFGIGLDVIDAKSRIKETSLYKESIERFLMVGEIGESIRLLYVALTRAKEQLILVGALKEKQIQTIFEKENVSAFLDRLKASCYLEWIIPILKRDKVKYDIELVGPKNLALSAVAKETKRQEKLFSIELKSNTKTDVSYLYDRFGYEYPHKELADKKNRYSVSELKESSEDSSPLFSFIPKEKEEKRKPLFLGGTPLDSAAPIRGTAMHRYMECLDFDLTEKSDFAEIELVRMVKNGLLTKEQGELIDISQIEKFAKSSLANRMRAAEKKQMLYREKTFVMSLLEGPIFVQGVIDAFFIEEDGIVLIDYKTDRVETKEELCGRYEKQIDLYRDAIERAMDKKVKESLLYSFFLGEEVSL